MALSTTWTEQSVVDFTAGTLSELSDCITYVGTKLKRGTISSTTSPTTTDVQKELIRGKEEMCEVFGFTWQRKYAYADTAAGTFRYALPADYSGGEVRLRDMTNDVFLEWLDPFRFDLKYPDPSKEATNKTMAFTIKDRELWIVPPAGGVYRFELEYGRSGDDSTATNISYLPEPIRFKVCDFAIYQSFLGLHMWQEASIYKQEWMGNIQKARRASGKQKWANSGFQCLTWQQAYTASFNQK